MSLFPKTIQRHLEGQTVKLCYLVELEFTTETSRLWTGWGEVNFGGEDWSGVGELGNISDLEQSINGNAPEVNFSLSGVDLNTVNKVRESFVTEALGNKVKVYIQFVNDEDDQALESYDQPVVIWTGHMRKSGFLVDNEGNKEISLGTESLFSLRSRPNYSQYSSTDQKKRFTGDLGFDFVNQLANKVVTWPDF